MGLNAGKGLKKTGASALDKGIPFGFEFGPKIASEFGLNILDEALHFPVLLLKESSLAYNLAAMAEWCTANNFLIAPHGNHDDSPYL